MLKQRVLTAVVLLAVLLPALLARSPVYFAAVTLIVLLLACWEWARLAGAGRGLQAGFPLIVAAACGALWVNGFPAAWVSPLMAGVVLCWAALLAASLPAARIPSFLLSGAGRALHLAFAALAACGAWVSLVLAKQRGAWFVLSLLLLVWIADTAAYFAGRAFGRHKLAPRISPGKTWEGAVAGVAAAGLFGWLCAAQPGSFYQQLGDHDARRVIGWTAVLAAVSIAGDLFESLLKRQAGMKDSSGLLPGHGGFLDRVDALLPTLPLAWLLL